MRRNLLIATTHPSLLSHSDRELQVERGFMEMRRKVLELLFRFTVRRTIVCIISVWALYTTVFIFFLRWSAERLIAEHNPIAGTLLPDDALLVGILAGVGVLILSNFSYKFVIQISLLIWNSERRQLKLEWRILDFDFEYKRFFPLWCMRMRHNDHP